MHYISAVIGWHKSWHASTHFCSDFDSVQTVEPKKRRRKDSSSSYIENNKEFSPGSSSYMGTPLRDSKRSTLQTGKSTSNGHKSGANGTFEYPYSAYRDKDAPGHLGLQQKITSNGANQDLSKNMHHKEKYNAGQFSGLHASSNIYSTETMVRIKETGIVTCEHGANHSYLFIPKVHSTNLFSTKALQHKTWK